MAHDIQANLRFLPMSAQKVRLVVDLVRGKDANTALEMLRFVPKAAAVPVRKLLASAVANAEENFGVSRDELVVAAPDRAQRLLDIGCGPGWTLYELPPGVCGFGLDRGMLSIAAAMPPLEQSQRPPYVQGNALRLPFPPQSFDTVLSLDLLEQRGVDGGGQVDRCGDGQS